ncbi:penicillin-binding transpeptidase domain-containing protein [Pelagicoccus sp. SDUM812002]|uniref:penicillin-binding transpeptidase domain-containing protein n=1 Tax=Pelagicoccus sp. SDUM812002 TaxID=3041266 RepID=UPI00280DBA88|nr:penicillin-binding transpeptidase domain-containing protein [Pelagicoccus sp. SDUM812002]MDQ8187373.1 penicillin-binding transpeptidase domain-containing protein [Pelagicoccus sp. SDUM812002]
MRFAAAFAFLSLCLSLRAEEPTPQLLPVARDLLEKTGYRGTVLVYDFQEETHFASHPSIAEERFIPASTFKILSTQAALQSGVVADKDSILKWDGLERGRQETNRDLPLTTAFRISSVPHYQELVREIGPDRMLAFVNSIPYGNQDISGGIDQFWLTGALSISPLEQIEFLVRLYQHDLPFDPSVMDSVKQMMLSPEDEPIRYAAKTGWAVLPESRNIGWWVGWAEKEGRRLFFATVLDSNQPRDDFGHTRIDITKKTVESIFEK